MYTNKEERISPIAVITPKKENYDKFLKQSGVAEEEYTKFAWVATELQTQGRRFSHVIRLEDYKEIPYWRQVYRSAVAIASHGQK